MIWTRMVDQMNRWILVKSGFIGSFNLPWSEWSRITDPDQDHLKGTHPLISKKVARNASAKHKEELCKTRTITESSQQSVETVQNATRSSNREQNILRSYIKHALSTSWANLCSFNGLPGICCTYRSSAIKTIMSIFEYHFQDKESKGTEKQATKNVQLVLQHCCKTMSWIVIYITYKGRSLSVSWIWRRTSKAALIPTLRRKKLACRELLKRVKNSFHFPGDINII